MAYDTELAKRMLRWLYELDAHRVSIRISDPGRGFIDERDLSPLKVYTAPSDIDIDGIDHLPTPEFSLRS